MVGRIDGLAGLAGTLLLVAAYSPFPELVKSVR